MICDQFLIILVFYRDDFFNRNSSSFFIDSANILRNTNPNPSQPSIMKTDNRLVPRSL